MAVKYSTTFICDRCGSTSQYEMRRLNFTLFSITQKYDLCSGCMRDFEKWLKSEVE